MSNEIQTTQPGQKVSSLSEFVKTLEDGVPETPCKLCNSKFRKEAEEMYDRRGVVSQITQWLKDKGEDISNTAVNNHINNHYKTIQRRADLKEYASEMKKWSALAKDDESLYQRHIESLDREYNLLMAENARLDPTEKRKNIELCIKISSQVNALKSQVKELNLEKRPVEIFVDTLNRIIKVKLMDITNPEVRRVLEDVVQQLNREVEQVPDL